MTAPPDLQAAAPPRWTVVAPAVLGGERIVVVRRREDLDDARAAHRGMPVYLEAELRELERHSLALVNATHRAKRVLDALIIPRDSALGAWSRERIAIPAEQLLGLDKENDSHE